MDSTLSFSIMETPDYSKSLQTDGTSHSCWGHPTYMCFIWPISSASMILCYVKVSVSHAAFCSGKRLALVMSWEVVFSYIYFLFLCTAKHLRSILVLITIALQKSLLTFLDNGWSVNTAFDASFCSCTTVSITILSVIGIQNIHYKSHLICQSEVS